MKELEDALSLVITGEVQRAEKAHGENYNSPHEAYAVLREEVEEAREASQHVQAAFDPNGKGGDIWRCIRLWGKIPACRDWLVREIKSLGDAALATAILDRLSYRCDKIRMNGKSYRLENRKSFLDDQKDGK